jgi:predicted CoA-substrate-specific enzyme activase
MITAGVDAGARAIKVALWDRASQTMLGFGVMDQGADPRQRASRLLAEALAGQAISLSEVAGIVATGYARQAVVEATATVTEITCHARGVRQVRPEARTVVEIGGQDSKVIYLDPEGGMRDFAMNDRCAAGSGRFLEMLALRLGVGWEELGDLARESRAPAPISSTCMVFAENEITGLLATGAPPADVVAGVQAAIASRLGAMVGTRATPPVVLTGGVALVPGLAEALEQALGQAVALCPQPQLTGALGAALLAAEAAPAPRRNFSPLRSV